jgi:hypothetical protein
MPSSSALNMEATGSSKTIVLSTTLHSISIQNTVFFTKAITKNYNKDSRNKFFSAEAPD